MTETLKGDVGFTWIPRTQAALKPTIVLAQGDTACRLLAKCLKFSDERLSLYEGLSSGNIVLIKSDQDLPWIKGVLYLGREFSAPNLYIPTHLNSSIPLPLVEKALVKKIGAGPIAALPSFNLLLPLNNLLTLNRHTANAWLSEYC